MGKLALASVLLGAASGATPPTFFENVRPILETHCQTCHRAGEIAPMPLVTYEQTRPFARAIRQQTRMRRMPPWFADPCCGRFANNPSLTQNEIATLAAWADANAPIGNAGRAKPSYAWPKGWNIDAPDIVLEMSAPVHLPAKGDVPYTYFILPTHFSEDHWVRMSEIRPSDRAAVHHAVAYIRPPGSSWLRGAPAGRPFVAADLTDEKQRRDAMWTASDILLVYAPGSSPDQWPEQYAKLVPAGSDIVLQMHYISRGHAAEDRTSVGLVFSKQTPEKRVLTLQLTNDRFVIPPGDPNYRVEVHGTIPNDALLLSFFPHMHLRGRTFEYNILQPHGRIITMLRVPSYDFHWQLSYRLTQPLPLKAGTTLQAVATFDNSRNNPHNPDPSATVRWGEQTWAEMMVGFFDVAVDRSIDKERFFVRGEPLAAPH